jgi:hypothetical protein
MLMDGHKSSAVNPPNTRNGVSCKVEVDDDMFQCL